MLKFSHTNWPHHLQNVTEEAMLLYFELKTFATLLLVKLIMLS